jgi:glycosyltransferase involved in cell wall biosynthesis
VARRIGIVCFRFGKEIVGGAESSLRTIAQSLQSAGQHVEVFTTCTQAEGDWKNELPAGTTVEAGLVVHRFPMDRHDRERHLAAVRRVNEAADVVAAADEQEYLRHSIHSSALLDALRQREDFDALIVGPYLFGLTHDVAEAFPKKTLLLPCFHDEPLARLGAWPATYGKIGGILLHSPEEQELMQTRLGVNHPSAVVIDTFLEAEATAKPQPARPYLVYCGRYSRQKNVPLLLEWFARYQRECPGRFILVFIGLGEVEIPKEPWLRDLGRVNETTKRETLAGAAALIQLSEQESLSLVALEAWRQETPVIVHRRCAVLAGQVERSGGGATVVDFPAFAAALDDLSANSTAWRERGSNGARYVEARYASRDGFVRRLLDAIDALAVPVRDLMVRQGLERARACDRPAWRESFGRIIDNLLHEPARVPRLEVELEPLHRELHAALDARTVLLPVRIHNRGDTALFSEGPGRTRLCATVRASGATRIERSATGGISGIILPGQTQMAMVVVAVPAQLGAFEISVTAEARRGHASVPIAETTLRLNVSDQERHSASCLAPFLDGIRRAITRAHLLEQLPDDYLDVTEGRFARAKRWVKKKLLNNFKHGYVDVVSRQQTQVNQQLVLAVQQLSECCAALESAVQGLQRRVDDTEVRSAAGSEHDEALAR